MRGADARRASLFTTVQLESFVPAHHPIRPLRELCNAALKRISYLFDAAYADGGRESIAPERLLRALLLPVLYGIPASGSWWSRRTTTCRSTGS